MASPSVAGTTTTAPAATPTSPASPSAPATSAVPAKAGGARADVPLVEIMAQLARRAERIAKKLPKVVIPTDVDRGSNRALGYQLMIEFGFPEDQWPYLDALWHRESGWNQFADNPTSSAYGIPQSLPGTKMAVVGADWQTNPETQIRWGLAYIAARYGNAQRAWAHSERVGWY
ncbi:lytic transglycosylase domain-containing protein [Nocardioides sp. GCM10030258]|uniref:aggregation-promoting factor C-terminal-like domain-containing protein n=1 Tax=unclassified Nocardioides TaxID=2615069 RepID=UPI003608BEE9